jgi:hypothetical protein
LDTLRLPRLYRSLNWECLAQHSELRHNEPLLKSSPSSPRELYNIPVGGGLYQEAKWVHPNDDSTVSGYLSTQGPNEQPHIIDLYIAPDYSIDLPIMALPAWFRHLLTRPGGDFHLLQNTVAKTDDWGLAREITCY